MDIKQLNEELEKFLKEDWDNPDENDELYQKYNQIKTQIEAGVDKRFQNCFEVREFEGDYYIDLTLFIDDDSHNPSYDYELVLKQLYDIEGFAEIKPIGSVVYITLDIDSNSGEEQIQRVIAGINRLPEIVDKYWKEN